MEWVRRRLRGRWILGRRLRGRWILFRWVFVPAHVLVSHKVNLPKGISTSGRGMKGTLKVNARFLRRQLKTP